MKNLIAAVLFAAVTLLCTAAPSVAQDLEPTAGEAPTPAAAEREKDAMDEAILLELPGVPDPFAVPEGLSRPPHELLWILGYPTHPCSTMSIAFTPNACQELAINAIARGMHHDAIALVNHGLRYDSPFAANLLFTRAYSQISLGYSPEAVGTLRELRGLNVDLTLIRERLNGPRCIQLVNALYAL